MPQLCSRVMLTLPLALLASNGATAQDSPRPLPTVEQQIGAAVVALPKDMRDSATVMGYRTKDKLEVLRVGTNGMTCLALFAIQKDFHVACYQNSMEPFMARGRELRAQGVQGDQIDSVRFREVRSGKIKMPALAIMYQLYGGPTSFDPATGNVTNVSQLLLLYMPYATGKSSGLSEHLNDNGPWLMFPGTPKAHMMLMGDMKP
jgi:hypothetical protein